jgi:two-component system, NarL family, nitrate/nitrite response regulator NarL
MEALHLTRSRRARAGPRIVIAGNHVPTRKGVRLALEEDGFIVAGERSTAPDAIAAALADRPDVCLLDVDLPGGAITAAEKIRSQLPETQVVILSEAQNESDLFAALEAGASGYLPKQVNPARLGPALRDVVDGGAALPRALTARLIEEFRARGRYRQNGLSRRRKNDLTSREWEIMDCLLDGLPTRKIAKRLFITETTVRRHVSAITKKLGVESREAAVELVASAQKR